MSANLSIDIKLPDKTVYIEEGLFGFHNAMIVLKFTGYYKDYDLTDC